MKKIVIVFLLAFGLIASSTVADSTNVGITDVEPKYLTSDTFSKSINTGIVIVEFVASFVEPFSEWEAIEDGTYYRVDIEKKLSEVRTKKGTGKMSFTGSKNIS